MFDYFKKKKIKALLDKYGVENYTLVDTKDGIVVDVIGHVDLSNRELVDIPVQFGNVSGYFNCRGNALTSLRGVPHSVGESFICSNNKITSLEFAPQTVGDHFDCRRNELQYLIGAPPWVQKSFYCSNNLLISLAGAPIKVYGSFNCSDNKLIDLIGAPEFIGTNFSADNNQLTTLDGNLRIVMGNISIKGNPHPEITTNQELQDVLEANRIMAEQKILATIPALSITTKKVSKL